MIAPSESACASRWPYEAHKTSSGDHDDPAADAEQSGEHTACYPDHDEAGREP